MDVDTVLVTDSETSETVEPSESAFDDPAIPAEMFAGFDATRGDAWHVTTSAAGAATMLMIVGLVGARLVGIAARTSAFAGDGGNSIEKRLERHVVVNVRPSQQEGEWDAATVSDEMAFCARPPSVGRVRPRRFAPFLAAMDELSMQTRLQSIRSAWRSRRDNSRCRRSQIPALCQPRSRRQQVTPEPQRISRGSIPHGMPVSKTKRMPVSAARAGIEGRPPLGLLRPLGKIASRIDQSYSDTSGDAMLLHESTRFKVQGL